MKQMNPTTVERLGEVTNRIEIMTTDGDTSQLTQEDIGDVYSWLLWAQENTAAENLQKLYAMTKDELDSLKGLVRDLLACPSLGIAGPKAIAIIEQLKALTGNENV